jgi:hypothetical protein
MQAWKFLHSAPLPPTYRQLGWRFRHGKLVLGRISPPPDHPGPWAWPLQPSPFCRTQLDRHTATQHLLTDCSAIQPYLQQVLDHADSLGCPIDQATWSQDVVPKRARNRHHAGILMSAAKYAIWLAYCDRCYSHPHLPSPTTQELLHRFSHQLHRLLHLIQACPSTTQRTTIRQAMHMPAHRPLHLATFQLVTQAGSR